MDEQETTAITAQAELQRRQKLTVKRHEKPTA